MVIVNGIMTNASNSNTRFRNISTIDYGLLFKYINNFIVHDNNPLFSDCHSALELSIDTPLIVEVGVQNCNNPIVSRQHVEWEHNKITESQCALNNNTDEFEKVNNLTCYYTLQYNAMFLYFSPAYTQCRPTCRVMTLNIFRSITSGKQWFNI